MHIRSGYNLCVAGFFVRTTAVKLHLSDENIDSTMLRWWYMSFQTLQDSFPVTLASLPLDRISYCMVLASADHRSPTGIADHLVVLVCNISCIKHHAFRAVRNLFDHLLKHRRIMHPSQVTAQDTIFLHFTSVTMCSLMNSHLE